MLRQFHPLWMNIHVNHPKEVTPELARACARLADAGIPLGNQRVLLAGVNAGLRSPKVLSETVRVVVGFLAFTMALEQISLGRQTILVAFAIAFGALMLGLAIAFGLGGRHLARRVLERRFLHEEKVRDDELSPL